MEKKKAKKSIQYEPILVHIFRKYWRAGISEFEFHRDELVDAAVEIGVERPDNLGDLIYSFKFRRELPRELVETAPVGKAWMLEGLNDRWILEVPMRYRVVLRHSEEGYSVSRPELPGRNSQGERRAEAILNIKSAIREYLLAKRELAKCS